MDITQGATANTNRDGTGTLVTAAAGVGTAGEGVGKRINRVTVKATVTTTAGMIRFYYSPDSGTTNRLITELLVTAITASATVASFESVVTQLNGMMLSDSAGQLRWSTEKAETFNVLVEGGLL